MVDLTVYYRRGRGPGAYLTPQIREVELPRATPRVALELLLNGPQRGDAPRLEPPLPRTTQIRNFDVKDGVARVTLSRHAVDDARRVGRRPEHEALALAAIANTLTEFPDVRSVRLQVAGPSGKRFWGYWGLPVAVLRDTSVIDPEPRNRVVPAFDDFSRRQQRLGVIHRKRQPAIAAVRARSFATYTRLTVEVTSANGSDLRGPVPPSLARHLGKKRLVLQVLGRPSSAVAGSLRNKLDDPAFKAARVDVRGKPHRIVVTLRPRLRQRPEFWLHAMSEPARIVLDIRR